MKRTLTVLLIALFASPAFGESKPIKWEVGSVGTIKTIPKEPGKDGKLTADSFRVREIISEDRVLVDSERHYIQWGVGSTGFKSSTLLRKESLFKPFILKGPSTSKLKGPPADKERGHVQINGEYKVTGTMNHKGTVYLVVEPVEKE